MRIAGQAGRQRGSGKADEAAIVEEALSRWTGSATSRGMDRSRRAWEGGIE